MYKNNNNCTRLNNKHKEESVNKALVTLAILLLILAVFAGCGTSTQTTTPPQTKTPPVTTPASTPTKPITTTPPATSTVPTTTTAVTPKFGGTLRIIYDAPPSGSIGYPIELVGDATFAPQLCIEPLIRENNKGEWTPWLAESYQLADDHSSMTIKLRKGIKFHDGSDFNAEVAKWNLDNSIAAKLAPYWTSVDIIDDYTVRINLSQWQNTMQFSNWMISKASFDKNGLDWVRQNPIGTGPYKFVEYKKDTSFKAVRNPDYWKKDDKNNQLPYLDAVEILFIADTVTQESAMQAGEADMLVIKHGSKVASDLASMGLAVKSAAIDTTVLFGDTANPDSPWANEKVREAVGYAIDREAIAKGMGYGYWKPAYQIPGSADLPWVADFPLARKYDVAKAKQLLEEAGYANGFTTSIVACPFSLNKDIPVAVQGYLDKIGIKAEVLYPDPGKFTTDYMLGKWNNALVYEPIAGFPNYMLIFTILFNPITNWHPSWERTPEWLEVYNAAINAPSPDVNLMRAATDFLTQHALMIPVNEGGRGWVYQSYVMDAGILETNLPPTLKLEQAWLNK
jgi:peptide/nickel transport system substrate-binding protein